MAIFGREAATEAQGDGPAAPLDVEYVSLSSGRLSVHPKNARRGDVAMIRESIRENGFYGSIIAQRSTGQILVGNHRYLAAVEEGLPEIPVVWVDKTDAEAARLLLVDNRSSDIGTYEDSSLVELLELVRDDFDTLLGTGYQDDDLEALLFGLEAAAVDMGHLMPDTPTPGERLEDYEAANIRSVILPFALEEYNVVVEQLARARADLNVETNSQAVARLVDEHYG